MRTRYFRKKAAMIAIFMAAGIFFAGPFNASFGETILKTSDLKKQAKSKAGKPRSIKDIILQKKPADAEEKPQPARKDPDMRPGPVKQPASLEVAVKMLNESREKTRLLNEQVAVLKNEMRDSLDKLADARIKLENDRALIRKLEKKLRHYEKTTKTYIVRQNDCLWKISARPDIYGAPGKWLWLYHANRDQIYDPNLIYPNMILLVPQYEEGKD